MEEEGAYFLPLPFLAGSSSRNKGNDARAKKTGKQTSVHQK